MTDPIADLLTRIRNAYSSDKETVTVPSSKLKKSILEVIKSRKFIKDFKVQKDKDNKFDEIKITLNPEITDITLRRISRPSQRIYISADEIKKVRGGLGVAIISTSKGIITGEEAKKLNIGGELICEIY